MMYHDEDNLYHYTYRRDGTEDHPIEATFRDTTEVVEPKKRKKSHNSLKVIALALVCALLGGAAGAGVTSWVNQSRNSTSVSVSQRPAAQVALKTVDGKSAMTDAEVYAANVNSVVSINTTGMVNTGWYQNQQSEQPLSSGSGFILTQDGYIVTNYHVINGANGVKVTLYNGDTYDARIIGGDEDYDIAVIKVEAADLQPVTLGDSGELNVGDRVLAIGNPLGELTFSMSGGMVSSVNRTINVEGIPFNMIQTDTSVNPGNSGGPLYNQYGEVVGIVSAKYSNTSSSESAEGLGFAIPINDVIAMIQDIMTNGYVANKPYLGATVGSMTQSMAQQYRYSISEGAFIYSVDEGGAAEQAGLQMGDVITKIDDTEITSFQDITAAKKSYSSGDACTLTVYRGGETITVELTWGQTPPDDLAPDDSSSKNGNVYNDGDNYYDSDDLEDFFNYFFGRRYGYGG